MERRKDREPSPAERFYPCPGDWILIANESALFRGPSCEWPREIWSIELRKWTPYDGPVPKPDGWGYQVGEWTARFLVQEFEPFTTVPDFGRPADAGIPTLSEYHGRDVPPGPRPAPSEVDPNRRRRGRGGRATRVRPPGR